jgi:hypothetical protein
MIDYLKYRWNLLKLQTKQKKDERFYKGLIKEATQEGQDKDEIEALHAEASGSYWDTQEEIRMLTQRHLLATATKLMVPIPDMKKEDDAVWEHRLGRYALTDQGIAHFKTAIRAERKQRTDVYMPWVFALTGLIGAMIGLLAIILGLTR